MVSHFLCNDQMMVIVMDKQQVAIPGVNFADQIQENANLLNLFLIWVIFDCQNCKYWAKENQILLYLPPELVIGDGKDDAKIDMWFAGIILYQLVTHEFPFKAQSFEELQMYEQVGILIKMHLQTINRPSSIQDNLLWDLLVKLLSFDRKTRLSASDALSHPFFNRENIINENEFLSPLQEIIRIIGKSEVGNTEIQIQGQKLSPLLQSSSSLTDPHSQSQLTSSSTNQQQQTSLKKIPSLLAFGTLQEIRIPDPYSINSISSSINDIDLAII
ncbi:MAG: hypothetical protein EZS28_009666 [Streblomastix strix]|uniref:Protein kinase domain-containing protein n=1 Tax=Streblomastix strix TaxID=222440 RepID=A0A5J4WKI5_9EUKA|nr:MAG: hypothetical protein EZS28_009666 [Streblomastix strix]